MRSAHGDQPDHKGQEGTQRTLQRSGKQTYEGALRHGENLKIKVKTSTQRTQSNFGGCGELNVTIKNSSRIGLNLIVSNIEERQGTQRTQQRSGKRTYHGSTETRRTAVRLAHPSYCICRMMSSPYQQHDCDSRIHQHKCCRIQPGRQ